MNPELIKKQFLLNDRNTQIGNICFQWAHLEFLLALTIWALLRLDSVTGRIVTGGLDIRPRVKMAIDLAESLRAPAELIDALKSVRKKVESDLNDRRNRAIHGHRFIDPDDPSLELVVTHRGKNAGKFLGQSNKDLADLGRDIAAAHKELHAVLNSLGIDDVPPDRPAPIIAKNAADKA